MAPAGDMISLMAAIDAGADAIYFGVVSMNMRSNAKNFSEEDKMRLVRAVNKDLQLYDSVVREYEYSELTYDLVVSSACFGQLKRHRMASIVTQEYNPDLAFASTVK